MKWIAFSTGLFFSTISSLYLYLAYTSISRLFKLNSTEYDVARFIFSNWTPFFYIILGISGAVLSLKGKKVSIPLILIIVFYEIARRIFFVEINVYGIIEIILALLYCLIHFSENFKAKFGLSNKNVWIYLGAALITVGAFQLFAFYIRS